MTTPINIGDKVRITVLVLDDGEVVNPASLVLNITDPSSNVSSFTYGIDAEIVNEDVGSFYFDLEIDELGLWSYSWLINGSDTEDGTVLTGQPFTLETVSEAAVAIPFANVTITDASMAIVAELQTDASGLATAFLTPGAHTFSTDLFNYRFLLKTTTLLSPGGGPAKDVSIIGTQLTDMWLFVTDLERVVSRDVIDRLFQDTNSNARDPELVQAILLEAQALAESKLLRSWSIEQIKNLAFHDAAIRVNAAWIGLELATERRGEFIASDGKGRYWMQYERAMAYFDALSKSKDHSRGEKAATQLGVSAAGKGSNSGGRRKPAPQAGNNFVFADEGDGTKHGGF